MPGTTVVHLLRHGEVFNPGKVLYGRLPGFGVSAGGRAMAEVAAEFLRPNDVAAVISSPLLRARQTAQPVAAAHDLPVGEDPRLIEPWNHFEGLTFGVGDGSLRHPAHWKAMLNPFRPSWGEPYVEVVDRMLAAVEDARRSHLGREVVLVSHQVPIEITRRRLSGRRLWHDPRHRQCALASVTSLTYLGDALVAIGYQAPAEGVVPVAGGPAGA